MKKIPTTVAWLTAGIAFVLIFGAGSSYGGGAMSKGGHPISEVLEVVGTHVKSPRGEDLGRVSDVVVASGSRVAFAILALGGSARHDEKSVAVPFDALSLDAAATHFILNISREALESAPAFDRNDAMTLRWAGDVYNYFGLQPSWTDGGQSGPAVLEQSPSELEPRGLPSSDYDEVGMLLDPGLA